ncbi:MAG TPA: hypothetical protein VHY84_01665 [Bryobacteraceae bacterium]|nr:hypothetical protein [Bryobacteraceae bacterium]
MIPTISNLNAVDTHLWLTKLEESRRERDPIDHFFRTLASTHDGNAKNGKVVATLPVGTGVDGAGYDAASGNALASNADGGLTSSGKTTVS